MTDAEKAFHRRNLEIMRSMVTWMEAVQLRLFQIEAAQQAHSDAVIESLCELSDRLAPLEATRHG